jgi:hypothetical protein
MKGKIDVGRWIDRTLKVMGKGDFYFLPEEQHKEIIEGLDKLWKMYKKNEKRNRAK